MAWHGAKNRGEMRAIVDPRMSEWGNPSLWEIAGRIHGPARRTRGTETSQYPEEQTSTEIPRVAASESGPGPWPAGEKPKRLERRAAAGDSPVGAGLRRGL